MYIKFMKNIILGMLCFWCALAHAQNNVITVSGYVLDKSDRSTIPAVSILSGNPLRSLGQTNNKGYFELKLPANAVLIFRFIGYNDLRVSVDGKTNLGEILLETKVNEMKEAVVIGYQTRTRETATGSSVNISGKDLQDVPVANVTELLQGRVAGVNIQNTTGMPGGRASIFVRGLSNIAVSGSGNDAFLTPTSPLFVIDGVPMDPNTNFEYGFDQAGPGMSPLSLIPPEDIESVDFLKDAMATALYGSQGAFGVIIITTKRGNSKTPIIQYTTNSFFNVPPRLKSVIGGQGERDMKWNQILTNDTTMYSGRDKIDNNPFLSDYYNPYFNNSTDWQSIFIGPTYNMTHNVSALGGDQQFNYKVNGAYYKENGIMKNTGFARYSLSMNTEYMPTTRFRLFTAVAANLGEQNKGSGNGVVQTGVATASSASSLLPPPSAYGGSSAALGAFDVQNRTKSANLRTNVDVRYEVFKGINLSNTFSYEYTGGTEDNFRPALVNNNVNEVYTYDDRRDRLYNRATISYTKSFHDDDHLISAYAFNELTMTNFMAKASRNSASPNDQYQGPLGSASGSALGGILNNYSQGRLAGFAGTLQYNYKQRYIVDFSYRIDGTSTNGPDMPFVKNPAAGLRWNFNKEKWLENVEWIDYGSVRASWGKNIVPSGSIFDANGRYVFSGRFNNNATIGLDWRYLPNTELTPMVTTQWSTAVEFGLFGGKVTSVLETYYKQVDNQLMDKTMPDHNAFTTLKTNEVSLVNYGYEMTFGYRPFPADSKWRWTINANGALNHDVLTRLPNDARQLIIVDEQTGQHILYRLGRNSLSNVLYHTRGVFASDADVPVDPATGLPTRVISGDNVTYLNGGDPFWTDLDGNYVIDDRDLVIAGNSFPRFTGGIQSFLQYNNFSLNINVSYTLGRDILNNALAEQMQVYANPFAFQRDADLVPISDLNYWQGQGHVGALYPNPYDYLRSEYISPFRFNQTLFQEDGSYWKINTVTLSYNIPRAFSQKYGISSFRVYGTANNVYTFSNYSGPDPENVSDLGRDRSNGYPMRRSYTIGLNVQF